MPVWKIENVDKAFVDAFVDAGKIDESVIAAHQAPYQRKRQTAHEGVKRWYYLMLGNARIGLVTVGQPIDELVNRPIKVVVNAGNVIGEFAANKEFLGQRGLKLRCEPLEWLTGDADREFVTGSEALAAISEQILDLRRAEQINTEITKKYHWKK